MKHLFLLGAFLTLAFASSSPAQDPNSMWINNRYPQTRVWGPGFMSPYQSAGSYGYNRNVYGYNRNVYYNPSQSPQYMSHYYPNYYPYSQTQVYYFNR